MTRDAPSPQKDADKSLLLEALRLRAQADEARLDAERTALLTVLSATLELDETAITAYRVLKEGRAVSVAATVGGLVFSLEKRFTGLGSVTKPYVAVVVGLTSSGSFLISNPLEAKTRAEALRFIGDLATEHQEMHDLAVVLAQSTHVVPWTSS